MYTIAETDDFIAQSKTVWSDDEKSDFITFLSTNPLAGDVIPKTGGFPNCVGLPKARANKAVCV